MLIIGGTGMLQEATEYFIKREKQVTNQNPKPLANINYHTIVLGYKRQGNTSRWLTHHEISDGVIKAVAGNSEQCIIGQIEPWNLHP